MCTISNIFGLSIDGMSELDYAYQASDTVEQLLVDIGLPVNLEDIGIKAEDIDELATKTLPAKRMVRNNPRVPGKKSLVDLFRSAL